MKAIVQTGPESVSVTERERPTVDADELLVSVHSSGVCGSDAHAYLYEGGYEWVELPRIMGHEYSGTVVEVGADVTEFDPGDRVVEEPTRTCGTCFQCRNGQQNVCRNFSVKGMHRDGSYAAYTVAVPSKVHTVPSGVSLEHAAITEPLSVATRAVLSRSELTPGDSVLVEGPGPIGVLVAAVADSMGARVLVSGLAGDRSYRLPLVADLGVETVALSEADLDARTDAFTDGVGFDVVVDATGHHTGVELAVEQVRKGGQVVVVGLPGGKSDLSMADVVRKEVDVNTSYGSQWGNFGEALTLLDEGIVDAGAIVDTSFSPGDPGTAFSSFLASETCKPVLSFADWE